MFKNKIKRLFSYQKIDTKNTFEKMGANEKF